MASSENDQERPGISRRNSQIIDDFHKEKDKLPSRTMRLQNGSVSSAARKEDVGDPISGKPIHENKFISNEIHTSKYTWYNFIFLNLFEQLTKPANFYFCCVCVLQMIPAVSITNGRPSIAVPLFFVVGVSAIKDWFEDSKRKREDRNENEKKFEVLTNVGLCEWTPKQSQNLNVGDIVKIHDNERFPADILLVGVQSEDSKTKREYCYVETSNIDGETNLKLKQVHPCFHEVGELKKEGCKRFSKLDYEIHADAPNAKLDEWIGTVNNLKQGKQNFNAENLLLRGSELRNSGKIYGMVIYTGFESKIFMNNQARSMQKSKISKVEKVMNKMIMCMCFAQSTLCLILAINNGYWVSKNQDAWYIPETDAVEDSLLKFFTWFIIFSQFIPISMLVSLELMRFGQMQFMQWDFNMTRLVGDETIRGWLCKSCNVQNSRLNEELGMVEFVFSDKTGTLTENSLDFRKCVIGRVGYGTGTTEIGRAAQRRRGEDVAIVAEINPEHVAPHVYFDQAEEVRALITKNPKQGSQEHSALMYARCLALNNTCYPLWEQVYQLRFNFGEDDEMDLKVEQDGTVSLVEERNSLLQAHSHIQKVSPRGEDDIAMQHMNVKEQNDILKKILQGKKPCTVHLKRKLKIPEFKASSPDDQALVNFSHFIGVSLRNRKPPYVDLLVTCADGSEYTETWKQIALMDFASHKKRMSVVLECVSEDSDCYGQIYAFIKGADSELMKNIWGMDKFSAEPASRFTTSTLDLYAEEGLRTLLVGYSNLPHSWWEDWEPEWQQAEMKLRPNTMERYNFEDKVDKSIDWHLVGATAIEDKLQRYVPETITSFLQAGMRVWILTGDKLETAKNVGVACDLLDPDMEEVGFLFQVDGKVDKDAEVSRDLVVKQINSALEMMSSQEEIVANKTRSLEEREEAENLLSRAGLLLTSSAFSVVTSAEEESLLNAFLDLALRVKSVVACRLQPDQKSLIVQLIRERKRVITMAVGDGANDEPMIRTANVGIGIAGLEGTAAVRASDYAIGQFSFLRRLLFVHGRNCYRRNSLMIYYILYKNALGCGTYLWFAFQSGFSGQPLYLDWTWQLLNVAYTALPIYAYALFDKDAEDEDLVQHPEIYYLTNGNVRRNAARSKTVDMPSSWDKFFDFDAGNMFQFRFFAGWIVEAFSTSAIIYYFTLFSWKELTTADSSGQTYGLWMFGVGVFTSVILVVNLRLFFVFESWTAAHILSLLLSFFAYFSSLFVFSITTWWETGGCDYYGIFFKMIYIERFWLTCLLASVVSLMMFSVVISYSRLFSDSDDLSKRLNELREQRRQRLMFPAFSTDKKPDT